MADPPRPPITAKAPTNRRAIAVKHKGAKKHAKHASNTGGRAQHVLKPEAPN